VYVCIISQKRCEVNVFTPFLLCILFIKRCEFACRKRFFTPFTPLRSGPSHTSPLWDGPLFSRVFGTRWKILHRLHPLHPIVQKGVKRKAGAKTVCLDGMGTGCRPPEYRQK